MLTKHSKMFSFLHHPLKLPTLRLPHISVRMVGVLVATLMLGFLFAPHLYTQAYFADLLPLLDGATRIGYGQLPHRDFLSPIGPLNYYAPFWIYSSGLSDIAGSIRTFSILCAGAAFLILLYLRETRLNHTAFLVASAVVLLTLFAQLNIGDRYYEVTIAMFYNKIGFCFVILVFIFTFKLISFRESLFLAILITFLFYLKFTFAISALALLIYTAIYYKKIAIAAVPILILLGISLILQLINSLPLYYLQDIYATIKSTDGLSLGNIYNLATDSFVLIFLSLIVPLYLLEKRTLHDVLMAAYCLAFGLILAASNAQWANIFLPLGFSIYVLNKSKAKTLLFVSLINVFLALTPPVQNIYYALRKNYSIDAASTMVFNFKPIGKMVVFSSGKDEVEIMQRSLEDANPSEKLLGTRSTQATHPSQGILTDTWYAATLEEGVAIAKAHCGENPRLMTLDYTNPFPLLLGTQPVGKVLFVLPTRTVSVTNPPKFEDVFQNANCILEPRLPNSLYGKLYLLKHYGAELKEKFKPIHKGKAWIIHILKN